MKRKVIVTGGLGFIGSNLIELLLKKNFFVINIDSATYSSNNYNTKDFKKNYRFIKCNINNQKKILNILIKHKPVVIFNLAAETHVDRSIDSPKSFIYSNIIGVFNILEIFRKFSNKNKRSKLIHISTDEVYGDILSGRTKETYPYNPSSPYAATKAGAELIVQSYFHSFKSPQNSSS